jgi:hypothetical protein
MSLNSAALSRYSSDFGDPSWIINMDGNGSAYRQIKKLWLPTLGNNGKPRLRF